MVRQRIRVNVEKETYEVMEEGEVLFHISRPRAEDLRDDIVLALAQQQLDQGNQVIIRGAISRGEVPQDAVTKKLLEVQNPEEYRVDERGLLVSSSQRNRRIRKKFFGRD